MEQARRNAFTCLSTREEEEARARLEQGDDDDDDDAFLRHYRDSRLQALQQQQQQRAAGAPVFGQVLHVTPARFLHAVDNERSDVYVVTLLYDKHDASSLRAVYCVKELARRLPHVKFLKAIATELKPEWDPVALPALLVYRATRLVTSFIRFQDDLGALFSSYAVAQMLAGYDRVCAAAVAIAIARPHSRCSCVLVRGLHFVQEQHCTVCHVEGAGAERSGDLASSAKRLRER